MSRIKLSGFSRKLFVNLAALALLVLFGVFYYYYFNRREQKLEERNFRILHRIEENFARRITDCRALIFGHLKTCPDCWGPNNMLIEVALDTQLNSLEGIRVKTDTGSSNLEWELTQQGQTSLIVYSFTHRDFPDRVRKDSVLRVSISLDPLLREVLRKDVFPSYFLGGVQKDEVAFNDCKEVCRILRNDTLSRNDHIHKLEVGNGKYYVFSHPFSIKGGRGMVLSGMLSAEQHRQDKYHIPGSFLLGLFVTLLIILLAFPFIKSFLVSAEETLRARDLIFALLSLFLICYLYVFAHMSIYTVSADEKDQRDRLKNSGQIISGTLLTELELARRQLLLYDSSFRKSTGVYPGQTTYGKADLYPGFYKVLWLNQDGRQINEVDSVNFTFTATPKGKARTYSDRQYFLAASRNELWHTDNNPRNRFVLEPNYSKVDGSMRATIAMRSQSDSATVISMAVKLRSVIEPVLPREIEYCILDTSGTILFTSIGKEHFQENFAEECDNSSAVKDALYSRSSRFIDHTFMGRDYSMYIQSIDGLPLFIVTLTNRDYGGNTQLQVCIYTSIFILITLLLLGPVMFFFIVIDRYKENALLKRPWLNIGFLIPSSKFYYRDLGCILLNLGMIPVLIGIGLLCRNDPFTLIALFLLNSAGTLAGFCFCRVADKNADIKFWPLFFLCLTIIYIGLYNEFSACESPDAFNGLLTFGLAITLFIATLRYYFRKKDLEKTEQSEGEPKKRLKFYNQFALVLVSWFALTTIVPSVFIFRYVHHNEIEYRIRSAQLDLARRISNQDADPIKRAIGAKYLSTYFHSAILYDSFSADPPKKQEVDFDRLLSTYRLSWNKGSYVPGTALSGSEDQSIQFGTHANTLILNYRGLYSHDTAQNRADTLARSVDSFVAAWSQQVRLKHRSDLMEMLRKSSGRSLSDTIKIGSVTPEFHLPPPAWRDPLPFLFLVLIFLGFQVLFYAFINFFLKRFFLFSVLPAGDQKELEILDWASLYNKKSLKVIILGPPSSRKNDFVEKIAQCLLKEKHSTASHKQPGLLSRIFDLPEKLKTLLEPEEDPRPIIIDLVEISKKTIEEFRKQKINEDEIIVLKHFEHNLADVECNKLKFELISHILHRYEGKRFGLFILSTIHPSIFLNNQSTLANSGSFNAEDYIKNQEYYKWTGLLSKFFTYVKRYEGKYEWKDPDPDKCFALYDNTKAKYIHYLSIWNSLDRVEKFVAYDLASDGLMNYRNKAAVYSLYLKGLVAMKDKPVMEDEELKTFILTEINESDVELEKQQSGSRSAWAMFRIPFLVILCAALVFVFLTQQETFNKLYAGLVAIGGFIGVLLRLFNPEKKQV